MQPLSVTILGDGGWGTAMAKLLVENGHSVVMWGHDPAQLAQIQDRRENIFFLPGVLLPHSIVFESDIDQAIQKADLVFVAIPTIHLRTSLSRIRSPIPSSIRLVSLVKGIERETLRRPSEIIREFFPDHRLAVLSGPSHAEEVARKKPTTVVVASEDRSLAQEVQTVLMNPSFRVYTASDLLGVEWGGAFKNVIAVAAGICIGLELGDNAFSALLTRGLAEMTRLGVALGAKPQTFAGLSGLGDLITTCVSPHGRNRAVGIAIGRGQSLATILAHQRGVAEGVTTVHGMCALGQRVGVELPIAEHVRRILYEGLSPREAVIALMTREPKGETDA